MNTYADLYAFVDFAKGNRKYPENTANNLKSALKIFEKDLTPDELESIKTVESRIEEIFLSVIKSNKNKSINSLNTYKARVLKVLNDFKRYGENPAKIKNWAVKAKNYTGLSVKKDKTDKKEINLSEPLHTPVDNGHKIELSFEPNKKATLSIPRNINAKETKVIKDILDSLAKE